MKIYQYQQFGFANLLLTEGPEPRALEREVVVKFHAASLNYRDLLFAKGLYNPKSRFPVIPLSDGAGEIVSLGKGVTRWKIGDRVCPIFHQGWIEGEQSAEKSRAGLGGGDRDGVLCECGVFNEDGLVKIPNYLSFEEASTLPCAAVTAWNALIHSGKLRAGETVLTLGTGGVSIFALQLARMQGARVIITSSSDEKLAKARELGANETINYKSKPDWDQEVSRLTDRRGVDHVIELGGAGTISKSVNSTCIGGHVAVIGVLAGGNGLDPVRILMKGLHLKGIFVGSRKMFEDMNRAITLNRLRPVIDKTFDFDQAREALAYMETGAHLGKIVIKF